MDELLTMKEFMKKLNVSAWKVRRWLADGTISGKDWQRMPGGEIRIKSHVILKIQKIESMKKNKLKFEPIRKKLTHDEILRIIMGHEFLNCHDIDIPEFLFDGLRIDLLKIDLKHKWVRGFEIKTDRVSFLNDEKWTLYTRFVSSLTIVCQEGIILPDEVQGPFGLLWITNKKSKNHKGEIIEIPYPKWVKKAKNFQARNSISWIWNYIAILEAGIFKMAAHYHK